MLVNATEMLKKARDGHYAVGHFNINNLRGLPIVCPFRAYASPRLCRGPD